MNNITFRGIERPGVMYGPSLDITYSLSLCFLQFFRTTIGFILIDWRPFLG